MILEEAAEFELNFAALTTLLHRDMLVYFYLECYLSALARLQFDLVNLRSCYLNG